MQNLKYNNLFRCCIESFQMKLRIIPLSCEKIGVKLSRVALILRVFSIIWRIIISKWKWKNKQSEETILLYWAAVYWNGKRIHEKEIVKKNNIIAIKEVF